MGVEIEYKYLVRDDSWRASAGAGVLYSQGYCPAGNGILRVRIAGTQGYLTIKGKSDGASRAEYEYPISEDDALELLDLVCVGPRVTKRRYELEYHGKLWVVDVFDGDNAGLVMAEIELDDPDEPFDLPSWAGENVTADPRYCNAALARNPWCNWGPVA